MKKMRSRTNKFGILILIGFFLLGGWIREVSADSFRVVEKEFFWASSNLTEIDSARDPQVRRSIGREIKGVLGDLAYQTHFDRHGTPPPLPFLIPLKDAGGFLATIENRQILFMKTGKKVPLGTSLIPSGADPASPYLLALPRINRVLVVYPYYLYQDKETRFMTEVYSDEGALLSTWESLPTHVSSNNPYLLVSPERSGCCESLKWSIRFYNLHTNTTSEYSCPAGDCGNVLMTRLGERGPFFIAQEIVGKVNEIGASMQINFFIVDCEGKLSASGKVLFAVREASLEKPRVEALSPFAVSKLVSVCPLPQRNSWMLRFGRQGKKTALRLISTYQGPTPCVAFVQSKDPSISPGVANIEIAGRTLGPLPLLLISAPGRYRFLLPSDKERGEQSITRQIQPDQINRLMF